MAQTHRVGRVLVAITGSVMALMLASAGTAMAEVSVTVAGNDGGLTSTEGQNGYIYVSTEEGAGDPVVQLCNGDPSYGLGETIPYDEYAPLDGYVYVSPSGQGPANPNYGVPGLGQYAGAHDESARGEGADSCPRNPSETEVTVEP